MAKALQRTRNSPPSDLVAENKGHAGMSIVALLGGGLRVWLSVLARIQAQLERGRFPSPLLFLSVSGVTPHIRSLM